MHILDPFYISRRSRWLFLHLPRHTMLLRVFCRWSVHDAYLYTCMSSIGQINCHARVPCTMLSHDLGPLDDRLDCGYWTRVSSCSSVVEMHILSHPRQHPSGQLHPPECSHTPPATSTRPIHHADIGPKAN
jgi:hypothetical protein